jgi:hypothetical protein
MKMSLPNTLILSKPFVERPVDIHAINQFPHRNILEFLTRWRDWKAAGIDRMDSTFIKSEEETWTGNKMRKMTIDELLNACSLLRLQHNNGAKFRKVDLEFIQGFEDYLIAGNKPDNRQRWRLGMLLIDYMDLD